MPSAREVNYWSEVSKACLREDGSLRDNIWKRPEQIRRLLRHKWIGEKVLEIGCGNGMVAGTLETAVGGNWTYIATELSPNFRHIAKTLFGAESIEADVTELPGSEYTRIIALDSLEHVRPSDRKAGYAKIASVAAKDALLFIHYSLSVSYHDPEFDHPFGLKDLCAIEEAGFALQDFERYDCRCQEQMLNYVFVVMKRTKD